MKSYTKLRTDYGIDSKNTSTANLDWGSGIMSDFHRRLLAKSDWPFLHRLRTAATVANTTFVPLAYDVDQVESVFVTVGTSRYNPVPAPSRAFWDRLHFSLQQSDYPQYWFVFNGELGLWPRPMTSSNVISINAKIRAIDLNTADITSTTITTLANNTQALTVSAGLTTQMAGFWIRPTFSTTANTGDGLWYEIGSVTNSTTATLVRPYGGLSIAVGTAPCTIGQMTLLPEAYQDLLSNYASFRYWSKEKDTRADIFKGMVNEGMADLFKTYGVNDVSMVLDDGEDRPLLNPNLTISLI